MSNRVIIHDEQVVTATDLTKIGQFAQDALDTVVADRIDSQISYAGFASARSTSTTVLVGNGRMYKGGEVYENDTSGGEIVDMLALLPTATQRIISIVTFAQARDTTIEPRSFLVDAATDALEARAVSTEHRRRANIGYIAGSEAPTPTPPSIPADQCEVARVLLDTTGVVQVVMVAKNRATSTRNNSERLDILEEAFDQFGRRVDTLATDLAAVAQRYGYIPSEGLFAQIMKDLANFRYLIKAPTAAVAYAEDWFLTKDNSATTHGNYLAKVDEGIRFANAQERIEVMSRLNPLDANTKLTNNLLLPNWTEKARVEVLGADAELALSNFSIQTVTQVQRSISRSRVDYGPVFTTCENVAEWTGLSGKQIGEQLAKDGETFTIIGLDNTTPEYAAHNQTWGDLDSQHRILRVQGQREVSWSETYWDTVTTTETLTGAMVGQTFLNSQAGWLTSVDLFFRRVGAGGDVHVMLCETTNAAPDIGRVLAKTTIAHANLKIGGEFTRAVFKPVNLKAGKRYGIIVQSAGAHSLNIVKDNKYAQGSIFRSSDQAWFLGNLDEDLAMRINFAQFQAAQVEVEFNPLQLENGFSGLSLLFAAAVPDGCSLVWSIQKDGVWYQLRTYAQNPLTGLPSLCRLKATFVGTTDNMPGIDMSQTEQRTFRPRTDFRHISTPRSTGGPNASTVVMEVTVDGFDPAVHTIAGTLLLGATTKTPATTTVIVDPKRAERRTLRYTFTSVGAATYQRQVQGTAQNAVKQFHVEHVLDYATT